jgi:hypothetical protein
MLRSSNTVRFRPGLEIPIPFVRTILGFESGNRTARRLLSGRMEDFIFPIGAALDETVTVTPRSGNPD